MAYPEEEVAPAEPYYGGGGSRFGYHLEGLIPLILIIIIAVVAGSYLGLWEIPFISEHKPINALIIGKPSSNTLAVFDQQKKLIQYGQARSAESLKVNPHQILSQYNLVILDQSTLPYKYIPRQLGEALTSYVTKGGKLIVVMNSGIMRKGDIGIVSWRGAFNSDIVPVNCIRETDTGMPTCLEPVLVSAQLLSIRLDHPIVAGIEVWPAIGSINFETFAVSSLGNEIAYLQSINTPETYPGIVEKQILLGKCIYFNYDPGLTPGILENTLKYLR